MENLSKALESKTSKELTTSDLGVQTTTLEPTQVEIEEILTALIEGKSYGEIKKTVRRVIVDGGTQVSAQGFSLEQIKEIDDARLAKVNESK